MAKRTPRSACDWPNNLMTERSPAAHSDLWRRSPPTRRDFSRATALFASSAELSSSVGDNWNLSIVTHNLGQDARELGDFRRAAELLEQSVALAREGGDLLNVAHFLIDLGQAELSLGNPARARTLIKEGIVGAQSSNISKGWPTELRHSRPSAPSPTSHCKQPRSWPQASKAHNSHSGRSDPPEQELRDYTQTAIAALDDPHANSPSRPAAR